MTYAESIASFSALSVAKRDFLSRNPAGFLVERVHVEVTP